MYLLHLCLLLSSVARSHSLVCTYCTSEVYTYSDIFSKTIACNVSSLQCPDGFLCSTSYLARFGHNYLTYLENGSASTYLHAYDKLYAIHRSCMPQESCNVNGSYRIALSEYKQVVTCCNTTDYCTPEIPPESYLTPSKPKPDYNGMVCPMCDILYEYFECVHLGYLYDKCRGEEHNCFHLEYTYVSGSKNYSFSQRGCATDSICKLNAERLYYQKINSEVYYYFEPHYNTARRYLCTTSDSEKSVGISITLIITLLTVLYHLILQ